MICENFTDNIIMSDEEYETLLDDDILKYNEHIKDIMLDPNVTLIEALEVREIGRQEIIKGIISFDHDWCKAIINDSDGFQSERFWCSKCHIYASIYENIKCISIIGKVYDEQPTYNTHNQYLRFPCNVVKDIQKLDPNCKRCIDCALPQELKTEHCVFV